MLEDLFEVDRSGNRIVLRDEIRLVALEQQGIAVGQVPIPATAWRPMAGSHSHVRIDKPFAQPARLRNLIELIVLRIRPSVATPVGTPFLTVDLLGWRPTVGEKVMALGYPDLDKARDEEEEADTNRPIRQYLYASVGEIVTVEPADAARDRPWPLLRIDANWLGGMSGGPVFNVKGDVIGIVSTGFEGEGGATATFFSGWDIPQRVFGSLDPGNPGRFINWGAFDADDTLMRAGQDKAEIERYGRDNGLTDFGLVSVEPFTGEWLRADHLLAAGRPAFT